MIISIHAKKPFYKIQYPFMKKYSPDQKVGIEETYLNITKAIHDKPTANTILNGVNMTASPLRQRCSLSLLLFNIGLEILAIVIRELKKKKE